MASPPMDPPPTTEYEIEEECNECGQVVSEEGRTDMSFVIVTCYECGNTWHIDKEDL